MAKHTPGPWHLTARRQDRDNGGEIRSVKGPQEQWIGDLRSSSDEDAANEALIAAAPALLDCVCGLAAHVRESGRKDAAATILLAELDALIAKAEGN